MLDMSKAFEIVDIVVKEAEDVGAGMRLLCGQLKGLLEAPLWDQVASVDYASDTQRFIQWLKETLDTGPPDSSIQGLWFGLVSTGMRLDDNGGLLAEVYTTYLGGSEEFEEDSPDWACELAYCPGGSEPELEAPERFADLLMEADKEARELGDYVLPLAYHALLVKEACRKIDPCLLGGESESRGVTVGYDDGDWLLIGTVSEGAFQSA